MESSEDSRLAAVFNFAWDLIALQILTSNSRVPDSA
jgi:hypothetical protein